LNKRKRLRSENPRENRRKIPRKNHTTDVSHSGPKDLWGGDRKAFRLLLYGLRVLSGLTKEVIEKRRSDTN